jgi:hypothetical protein
MLIFSIYSEDLKTGNGKPFVSSNLTASANKNERLVVLWARKEFAKCDQKPRQSGLSSWWRICAP